MSTQKHEVDPGCGWFLLALLIIAFVSDLVTEHRNTEKCKAALAAGNQEVAKGVCR